MPNETASAAMARAVREKTVIAGSLVKSCDMRRSDGVVAPCNRLGRQAGYIARDFPRRQRASPAQFASPLHGQGRSVAEVHQYPHRDLRQDRRLTVASDGSFHGLLFKRARNLR